MLRNLHQLGAAADHHSIENGANKIDAAKLIGTNAYIKAIRSRRTPRLLKTPSFTPVASCIGLRARKNTNGFKFDLAAREDNGHGLTLWMPTPCSIIWRRDRPPS
jgi:hypothetical protein